MENESILNLLSLFVGILIITIGGIIYLMNPNAAFISYAFSTLIISFLFLRYNKNRLYKKSLNRTEEDIYPRGYIPQYQLYTSMFIGFLISIIVQAFMFLFIDLLSITYEILLYIAVGMAFIVVILFLKFIKKG